MSGDSLTVNSAESAPWKCRLRRHHSIALRLAWRNFARDRVRLLIAVTGVAFAVLLMTLQLGLLIGFATTSSSLVDQAKADLWIVPRGAKDVDQAGQILERQKFAALGLPDVKSVESLIVAFSPWKRPDGGTENVIVIGTDPNGRGLHPWNFVAGSAEDLRRPDGIVIDELYAGKLGITGIGQTVEILSRRARVVGITSGIRTFTQSPYVFASLENARRFGGVPAGWTTYLLVRAKLGTDLGSLMRSLQTAFPSEDIWTTDGFSWQTRFYWLMTTGAGAALLVAAVLGVIVGMVIVAQTLYSAAVERMEEFAAIRAMGAGNKFVASIILQQATFAGVTGYAIGTEISLVFASLLRHGTVALSLPVSLMAITAVITLIMCAGASLIPIKRFLHAVPASLFR